MDLFTYLMAKNGHNTSIHEDLFSYLLGASQGGGGEIKTATGITINIPDAKKLVSFMMTKESTQDGTPTPESPVEVKTITGSVDVKVVGKNLYNENSSWNIDGSIASGTNLFPYTTGGNRRTYFFLAKPNTTYTFSFKTPGDRFLICEHYSIINPLEYTSNNPIYLDRQECNITENIPNSYTFTTTSNTKMIVVYYSLNQLPVDFMIEENSTATTYEAYQETNVPIPLNNNEIVGIGDYKDELKVDKSGHVFINKKTGKVVLNGTEDWRYALNSTYVYLNSTIFDSKYKVQNAFSNYFINKVSSTIIDNGSANSQLLNGEFTFRDGNTKDRIYFKLANIKYVEDFKAWLSTHNTEVYYVLANPQLIDLQTTVDLKLFKGVNNISNSEDGYMTIEYH